MHIRRLLRNAVAAACLAAMTASVAQAAAPVGLYTRTGAYRYLSQPKLAPPIIKTVKQGSGSLAPGYFLIANFKNLAETKSMTGQGGPIIYDSHLQPIWIHGVPDSAFALNFRTQSYGGKPALSWWQGVLSNTGVAYPGAQDIVVDQHYHQIATLTGQEGWTLSVHEFVIQGTDAWVTAYKPVPMPAAAASCGANPTGQLLDSAVQEYDLKTGKLLYTWDAAAPGHIDPCDSHQNPPANPAVPWDAYHVNAIQLQPNGDFLTSMRNTWAAYMVDPKTGGIVWTLGGKHSDYTIPTNATFEWQHDVQVHSDGTVSMFDNGCCGFGASGFLPPDGPTRALVLRLDTAAHAVTLVSQYSLPGVSVGSQGDTQLLPNGNVLVGFGQQPYFAEFTKAGKLLLEAQMPDPDESYRAFVENWVGLPLYGPSAVARRHGRGSWVFASWNGATKVVWWRVIAGANPRHLVTVGTKRKSGFETTIKLASRYKDYKLVALDGRRHVLRRSGVFHVTSSRKRTPPPGGFY